MTKNFETIRARTKDDAVVLIDRLLRTKQDDIVLILPKNSMIAADSRSLKNLQEEAESVGKNLFLSTENEDLLIYAEKIKMPIYKEEQAVESESISVKPEKTEGIKINLIKQDNSKKIMDIRPPRSSEIEEQPLVINEPKESLPESEFIPTEDLVVHEVDSRDFEKNIENFYKSEKSEKSYGFSGIKKFFTYKVLINSFIVAGAVLLASSLFLILPKVAIKIAIKEIPIKTNISVAVSKSVSSANLSGGIIPGQYFIFSKSETKPMVNTDTAPVTVKSAGYIFVYNSYSAVPQKLIAQTRFEAKDGKIFRITEAVIVPGAKMENGTLTPSSIKVKVVSDAVGEQNNIGPSYFTIPGFKGSPKYAGFYAKSTESMISETISSPMSESGLSKESLDALKNEMQNELSKQIESDVLGTLKDGDFKLIDGASSSKIDEFKIDANSASMKITWQAVLFKEKDFKSLVNYFVSSRYQELKNFDFREDVVYPQVTKVDYKKGEMFFTYSIDKANAYTVNLDELRSELVGKNENEIRSIISGKNFINSATISFPMFWFKKAPNSPEKINITIDK